MLIPRSLVVPEGAATKDAPPLPAGSSPQGRMARHAISSGRELTGPEDGRLGPDESQPLRPAPPAPPIPVAVTGLRGEWGPALDWPETTPASSGESTDATDHGTGTGATDYRPDTTDYRSDSTDYRPLGYPDEGTIGRPTEFTPRPPEGGNGPGSVIPATAEEIGRD